ncbi:MAG: hypothetical protein ACR2NB_00490, partial [Solirubrobacteraceae bacterium]
MDDRVEGRHGVGWNRLKGHTELQGRAVEHIEVARDAPPSAGDYERRRPTQHNGVRGLPEVLGDTRRDVIR